MSMHYASSSLASLIGARRRPAPKKTAVCRYCTREFVLKRRASKPRTHCYDGPCERRNEHERRTR
jgi:hypothetical protein